MGFNKVIEQYEAHRAKQIRRTPGPVLNPKRTKVVKHCEDAINKIGLGVYEVTGEGFVMRTDAQLESGKGWAKK